MKRQDDITEAGQSAFFEGRAWPLFVCVCLLLFSCSRSGKQSPQIEEVSLGEAPAIPGNKTLKDWGLFEEPLKELKPVAGILPYDLNTPLFSDYALKARFVKLPAARRARYHPAEVMEFPKGTILIKNFYYLADFNRPDGARRIIETRLLINEGEEWKALTYVWNDEQTNAFLEIAGRTVDVSWKDKAGVLRNVEYSVPNLNQCKSCHDKSGRLVPIGPTGRQLNREFDYTNGTMNQLVRWEKSGMLEGLPEDHARIPRLPVWDRPETGELAERARAWLEINCAHCHRAEGPAKNTGLYLEYAETDLYRLGVNKPPVAAGRGSGGLRYGIVPGRPDESILVYRIESLDPGIMMPEVGRKTRHREGIELVRKWIESMEPGT